MPSRFREGIAVSVREDAENAYIFIQNYNAQPTAFSPDLEGAEVLLGVMDGEMETVLHRDFKKKEIGTGRLEWKKRAER